MASAAIFRVDLHVVVGEIACPQGSAAIARAFLFPIRRRAAAVFRHQHVAQPQAQLVHVHVDADPPVKGMQALGPVWVESTLEIVFSNIDMGRSCYRMKVRGVTRYK